MNTNTNNEQVLKLEDSIRVTQQILQDKLNEIKMFGMPRSSGSCLQMNRHLDFLRQNLREDKAKLAELQGIVEQ
jgi:hypothetical protein